MNSVLDHYRSIEQASCQMLVCARDELWSDVAELRQRCEGLIGQLRNASAMRALSKAEQAERMRLLRNIVLNEGEVRRLGSRADLTLDRVAPFRPANA